jgi:hypothetical protein
MFTTILKLKENVILMCLKTLPCPYRTILILQVSFCNTLVSLMVCMKSIGTFYCETINFILLCLKSCPCPYRTILILQVSFCNTFVSLIVCMKSTKTFYCETINFYWFFPWLEMIANTLFLKSTNNFDL